MITQEAREQFEREQRRGIKASHAYNDFIKPLLEEKREILFQEFGKIQIDDTSTMQEIRRHLTIINTLDTEIQAIIATGRMAAQTLMKEPAGKH